MKNLIKLTIALIIITTINSCKKDNPCDKIYCDVGSECNDGLCFIDLNQEVRVIITFFQYSPVPGVIWHDNATSINAVSHINDIKIDFPNNALPDESSSYSILRYSSQSYTIESYMGSVKFELEYEDQNNKNPKVDFNYNLDIDSVLIPEITLVQNASSIDITWITNTVDHSIVQIYKKDIGKVFEKEITSNNINVSSSSGGWVSPYNNFESNVDYYIYISSHQKTIEETISNVSYTVKSSAMSAEKEFTF